MSSAFLGVVLGEESPQYAELLEDFWSFRWISWGDLPCQHPKRCGQKPFVDHFPAKKHVFFPPTCCFFPCCTCCASWRSEFCVYLLGMLRSIMVVTLLLIGNKSAELSVHPINPSFGHRTSPTSPLFCRLNATASTIKRRWSVASDVVH